MDFLVGYTGFVGSNILSKHDFSGLFNSKNIKEAYGKNPDLLVYSGVPAEMFLANQFPEKDLSLMDEAIENITKINAGYVGKTVKVLCDEDKDTNGFYSGRTSSAKLVKFYSDKKDLYGKYVDVTVEDFSESKLSGKA